MGPQLFSQQIFRSPLPCMLISIYVLNITVPLRRLHSQNYIGQKILFLLLGRRNRIKEIFREDNVTTTTAATSSADSYWLGRLEGENQ